MATLRRTSSSACVGAALPLNTLIPTVSALPGAGRSAPVRRVAAALGGVGCALGSRSDRGLVWRKVADQCLNRCGIGDDLLGTDVDACLAHHCLKFSALFGERQRDDVTRATGAGRTA